MHHINRFGLTPGTAATHSGSTIHTLSLADVAAMVSADLALTLRSRMDMLSALRTLSRVLDTGLGQLAADPVTIRHKLAHAGFARIGISPSRWDNVRSHTLKALPASVLPLCPAAPARP